MESTVVKFHTLCGEAAVWVCVRACVSQVEDVTQTDVKCVPAEN